MEEFGTTSGISTFKLENSEKQYIKRSKIRDFIAEKAILFLTVLSALMIIFIFIFILQKSFGVFARSGVGFIFRSGFDAQVAAEFNALPQERTWVFGALGLLVGSLLTTIGSLIIAIPMGIGTSIIISELAPSWTKKVLQSGIRLLAAIPSIIFGLIGMLVVIPFIQKTFVTTELQLKYIRYFQMDGKSLISGILVLSIMILPIIIALSVDAINAVPRKYKEASLALGLSHWRTIVKVILPSAKSGILAGSVLAIGRAMGEAIALSMVSGGVGNIPNISNGPAFFLTPVLTLASAIVNKSEAMSAPSIESALFACGVLLLITTTALSIFTRIVEYTVKRRQGLV
jgi:phosphate ABC transporter, permease protein PstC